MMRAGGRIVLALTVAILVVGQYAKPISTELVLAMFAFAAAMFVLDMFDVLLPHGQSIGVDGALAAAAFTLLGPVAGSIASLIARLASMIVTRRKSSFLQSVHVLERRQVAIAATTLLLSSAGAKSLLADAGLLVYGSVAAAAMLLIELAYAQLQTSLLGERSLIGLIKGNLRLQMPMLAAQISACGLTVITYQQMGSWSLVMALFLLLLIRQSYALLLDVRDAYRNTVGLLIDAAESTRQDLAGHAERVASIACHIAAHMGLSSHDVETISYAAMLHDVDLIAEEGLDDGRVRRRSGEIAAGVEFLSAVAPVLRVCDGDAEAASGSSDRHLLAAFIVALASDIDTVTIGTGDGESVRRVSVLIPDHVRGRVTGAAVALGYPIPAMTA